MNDGYVNVSGATPNRGAKKVFVWCRAEGRDGYALVGEARVVGADDVVPPGIQAGQFRVTLQLPHGCSPDSVVVTDDEKGQQSLPGVVVIDCSTARAFSIG